MVAMGQGWRHGDSAMGTVTQGWWQWGTDGDNGDSDNGMVTMGWGQWDSDGGNGAGMAPWGQCYGDSDTGMVAMGH